MRTSHFIFLLMVLVYGCGPDINNRIISSLNTSESLSGPNAKNAAKQEKFKSGYVYVTKVIDGDTFWIDDGAEKGTKIRLIGIDAPETRNTRHKKKGYLAKEVKNYVSDLIEGKWVRLEFDVRKLDQYKRSLAYVYLEDQTFLNAHLVEIGYATVDTHPPNIKFVDIFIAAQKEARAKGKGIWINAR